MRPTLSVVFREAAPLGPSGRAGAAGPSGSARALLFTRGGGVAGQRAVFGSACAARGWVAGGAVRELGSGWRGWAAALRLACSGGYDVLVVDRVERLADTEGGRLAALAAARRAGVRLLVASEGWDTGEEVGAAMVASLLSAGVGAAA